MVLPLGVDHFFVYRKEGIVVQVVFKLHMYRVVLLQFVDFDLNTNT